MNHLFAELMLDPAWPRPLAWLGWTGVLVAGLILAGLTVWTYAGQRGTTAGRVLAVLALRLGALLVACLVLLRPSFADREQAVLPSKLLFLIDSSASMNMTDEFNGQKRWDAARNLLEAPAVAKRLRRLQNEQKVEILYYQGAEDVRKFDPKGQATGKRTDVGQWLRSLLKVHGGEQNLRGLAILSDGADNGTRFPALEEAARWRGVPCPISTFALGSPTSDPTQRDIAVTAIHPDPQVVPVKNKLTVKAMVNAPGLEGQLVTVRLLIDNKEVSARKVRLPHTRDNEVVAGEYRPEKPREIKVTVKIDPVNDEVTAANNEMSTYVTVTNEGVSVLWVEGKMRYEPVFAIREALARDKRFSVFYTVRLPDGRDPAEAEDWFNFKNKHYDVIVIGDIPAKRFAGGREEEVFGQIEKLVTERGTGLLMLGGYDTFANGKGGWAGEKCAALQRILPVTLDDSGQVNEKVRVEPTKEGVAYVLRLAEDDKKLDQIWQKAFERLDGMAKIGTKRPDADVFARAKGNGVDLPILVARTSGAGRTMAFGGDTTWKAWRRTEEAVQPYERFWKQVVLWLAKREEASGNTYVIPDTRRVAAGNNNPVGFTVGVRGKGGVPLPDAKFTVRVEGPDGQKTAVETAPEGGQQRGYFYRTNEPGDYTIWVKASGKDTDGKDLDEKEEKARFICYAQDLENLRTAADHGFLKKLAGEGGGTAYLGKEDKLTEFLDRLLSEPLLPSRSRADVWPDWRRAPLTKPAPVGEQVEALWVSGLLLTFVLFVTFVSLEWYLRRRWGMV
jgi:uncharacterized membrane protein